MPTTNNSQHKGGRIWVIWKSSKFNVDILDNTAQTVHLKIRDLDDSKDLNITFIYGFNFNNERDGLWHSLEKYVSLITLPWCVCGDFNNVRHFDERIGSVVTPNEVRGFQDCISNCNLSDLKTIGSFLHLE